MTNYSTTLDVGTTIGAGARATKGGFWGRFYKAMIKARQDAATREIERYYSTLNEQTRKDLGFPTAADRR